MAAIVLRFFVGVLLFIIIVIIVVVIILNKYFDKSKRDEDPWVDML